MIILCDGDTVSESGWVAPTLERIRDRARVVFQCVQLGDQGDGTLELLASMSGGNFIHVQR
jgi:hypothetical protein